ncbi:MAG: dihydroxy-acid dehydratase [Porticoccaceae bacterium]
MYTANTLASAIEALRHELAQQFSAGSRVAQAKHEDCRRAGEAVAQICWSRGYCPSRHHDSGSVRKCHCYHVIALGGSTNAVLHLMAMANAMGVKV